MPFKQGKQGTQKADQKGSQNTGDSSKVIASHRKRNPHNPDRSSPPTN